MITLPALLELRAPAREVASLLDDLGHEGRLATLASLGRGQQRALYEAAAGAEPLTLDDFTLPREGALASHHGFNTLPLPSSGRSFVKEMTRRPDGSVVGWNRSPYAWLIGPGCFVLRPTEGDERVHGGVVVDYTRTPWGPVPDGWPRVRPNWLGLQAFVYGWCHDYLRRVSRDVTIGAAYKWGVPVRSWFVLARGP